MPSTWVHELFNFKEITSPAILGASQVWLAFNFASDALVQYAGQPIFAVAAETVDAVQTQKDYLPFVFAFVLGLSFLLLMMVFHFTRVYRYHLTSGYPGWMQARYYLPLMPCVLMLSFRPFADRLHSLPVRVCLRLLAAGLVAGSIWFYWFRLF